MHFDIKFTEIEADLLNFVLVDTVCYFHSELHLCGQLREKCESDEVFLAKAFAFGNPPASLDQSIAIDAVVMSSSTIIISTTFLDETFVGSEFSLTRINTRIGAIAHFHALGE